VEDLLKLSSRSRALSDNRQLLKVGTLKLTLVSSSTVLNSNGERIKLSRLVSSNVSSLSQPLCKLLYRD